MSNASFAYVCRGAAILASPNRRQASDSRICEGSLYIALRLIRIIPARRLPGPVASRLILQDRFGARSVRFPLFFSENAEVPNKTPPPGGAGMRRSSAGSVFHTSSLAPWPGFTCSVRTPRPGRNPVTWNMYMSVPKNSGFPSDAPMYSSIASAAAVGRPASSSSLSFAGGTGGTCAASRSKSARYSAFVRNDASAPPACSLATFARTLPCPAGNSDITTARPLNISQNRSLPTAASMLPPIPAPIPQPVDAQQPLQQSRAPRAWSPARPGPWSTPTSTHR